MGDMHAFDFASLSDATLLQWQLARSHRPNVLVECGPKAVGPVVSHLLRSCEGPHNRCTLPGALELPRGKKGTLLLENIAALTSSQQRQLYEWLSDGTETQVVSVHTTPLKTVVQGGEFREDLLYRLNVVRIDAPAATAVPLSAELLAAEKTPSRLSVFGNSMRRLPAFNLRPV